MKKENFKFIKPSYIDRKMAVAIANSNLGLKQSLYINGLKENINFGLITFSEFQISLVKYNSTLAWKVSVIKGEWGGMEFKKIPCTNIKIPIANVDGYFNLDSNIWCLIAVEDGWYTYKDEVDEKEIKEAANEDLELLLNKKNDRTNSYVIKKEKDDEEFEW